MAREHEPPLVVDLDGTLIRSDLLHESTLRLLHEAPWSLLLLPGWLAKGKAALKRYIAERVQLDIGSLPFDERVVEWIDQERSEGRRVVLCTASDRSLAEQVAGHLKRFDEVIASDGTVNVSAERKAEELTRRFGPQGFDYAGNSTDDIPVWEAARHSILVSPSPAATRGARRIGRVVREFDHAIASPLARLRIWTKALRLHQWLKNLLVFVPLLAAHQLSDPSVLAMSFLAFVGFCLCASSVYLVNDLMDLESDRRHPRKRARPFAAGLLSPLSGVFAVPLLLVGAASVGTLVGGRFVLWLGVYLVLTLVYTFYAKRKLLLDAIVLAGLYTLRIVAGAVAVGLATSFWLLAFSLFLFLSLAYVKRYSELLVVASQGRRATSGRSYMTPDLSLVEMLGVASAFSAVLVMALYLNSENVLRLYASPQVLWLTLPVLLYWISRMWLQAHRGQMDDDPLLFAVRDRVSLACGALFLAVLSAAGVAW